MSLCLASATVTVALAWSAFTLSWTHSVEKIAWEEDWAVTASGLEIVEARVKGAGAGMEPPPDARFVDGWWRYRPSLGSLPRLVLARSTAVSDWRLCELHGGCTGLEALLRGAAAPVVTLAPCPP